MEDGFLFELSSGLPDPGDIQLAARLPGGVRSAAFRAAEQFLRAFTGFASQNVRAGIYLLYDPCKRREKRTRVFLMVKGAGELPEEALNALLTLVASGPLASVYPGFTQHSKPESLFDWLEEGEAFDSCFGVRRRVERQEIPQQVRENNHRLTGLGAYMAVHPFQCRDEQDWMGVDRLLDQLEHRALIEILVAPANRMEPQSAQAAYHYRLSQINAMESPMDRHLSEDARRLVMEKLQQDHSADYFLKLHDELQETMRSPQVFFDLRCWSASEPEARVLSALVAEEAFQKGNYEVVHLTSKEGSLEKFKKGLRKMGISPPAPIQVFSDPAGEEAALQKQLSFLPFLCPPEQLISIFRLPLGQAATSPRTMSLHTDPVPSGLGTWDESGCPTQSSSFLVGEDLEISEPQLTQMRIQGDPRLEAFFRDPDPALPEIRLERKLLQKHLFVCGVPGSGKTTAMFNFLLQLYYQQTPFLILEPAKTEYRMFKRFTSHPDEKVCQLAQDLRVYTLGDESTSPFRFNPLIRGEGVSHEEHLGALMACLKASMPIDGPLEGILQEALSMILETPPVGRMPRLSDLVDASLQILEQKGYDGEITGNLRAALEVRLGLLTKGSLGKVFECDANVPSREELFSGCVVVEMDALSSESSCLLTLLLLTGLRQYLRRVSHSGSPLRHVVFLEEAHNIVGRGEGKSDGPDPKRHAAEYIARMLAEVRALGEGMVIADQLPSAVAPEVIKNTGSKLALRLVATDDREELGGTMLLDKAGEAELARLSVGTGFFYREGYYRPRRVQTFNSHAFLGATRDGAAPVEFEPPDSTMLRELLESNSWFQAGRKQRKALESMAGIRRFHAVLDELRQDVEQMLDRLEPLWGYLVDDAEVQDASMLFDEVEELLELVVQEWIRARDVSMTVFMDLYSQKELARFQENLLETIQTGFLNHMLPLLGRWLQCKLSLEVLRALLEQDSFSEDETVYLSPFLLQESEEEDQILCETATSGIENWLSGAMALMLDSGEIQSIWPPPPDPIEPPDDPTEESVLAYYHLLKQRLADGSMTVQGICDQLVFHAGLEILISGKFNPLLNKLTLPGIDLGEDVRNTNESSQIGFGFLQEWIEELREDKNSLAILLNAINS